MNEQRQREKNQLQRALDALNHAELRAKVLMSCKDCGMTRIVQKPQATENRAKKTAN